MDARALLVDLAPAREDAVRRALRAAGRHVVTESVSGERLEAALLRGAWDAVVHGGDGSLTARKALALVRRAAPQVPFVVLSPTAGRHDLAGLVAGLGDEVAIARDPAEVPTVLARALRRRGDGGKARRLLLAQQAITAHIAAGPEPAVLFARVLATLGDTLGWSCGAAWRPQEDGLLAPVAVWHADDDEAASAFAATTRETTLAPGRGLPGRAFAFRRPQWVADARREGADPRGDAAARAGLGAAVAFPIALADECLGVLEFFAPGLRRPDAEMSALFVTVGGQLAQCLERARLRADESARAAARLRHERDRAERYLELAGMLLVGVDPDGRVTRLNAAAARILGWEEDELLGRAFLSTLVPETEHPRSRAAFRSALSEEIETYEGGVLTRQGDLRTVAWRLLVERDDDGAVVGMLGAGEDVTERRAQAQALTYLAYHDGLTGLANRTLLHRHLVLALERGARTGDATALLHLDVDGFRLVNESLGHAGGDALLRALAARLAAVLPPETQIARIAGDEFLLLLADLDDDPVGTAERAAEGALEALEPPFGVGGTEVQVTASIGLALAPRDARDADALLGHADAALRRAKDEARGSWVATAAAPGDAGQRLALAARLRRALAADALTLHYQPIWALETGALAGVEALLRWEDPERGPVSPALFVPVAEETGLIGALGDWVVRAVCRQQAEWARREIDVAIAFNVSPHQLRRLDFPARLAAHIAETGADPSRLTVELTESATLRDPEHALEVLSALAGIGVGLALDDFGSGYSSLSRLGELPVGTLKIDRAFLRGVPEQPEATAMLGAILQLARALGRTVVVEGVETEEQEAFLRSAGAPLAQGFLLGRPMPAELLETRALLAGSPV